MGKARGAEWLLLFLDGGVDERSTCMALRILVAYLLDRDNIIAQKFRCDCSNEERKDNRGEAQRWAGRERACVVVWLCVCA